MKLGVVFTAKPGISAPPVCRWIGEILRWHAVARAWRMEAPAIAPLRLNGRRAWQGPTVRRSLAVQFGLFTMVAPPPAYTPFRQIIRALQLSLVRPAFVLGLVTVPAYYTSDWAWLARVSPFRPQAVVGLAGMVLVCLLMRNKLWAILLGGIALFNAGAVWRSGPGLSLGRERAETSAGRVLVANVLTDNRDWAALVALIERERPDVVALLEVNRRWRDELEASPLIREWLPYREYHVREDNFGLAFLTRWSGGVPRLLELSDAGVPSLETRLDTPAGRVCLLITHPVPPGDAEGTRQRDRHLAALAEWRRSVPADETTWVAGDFNATPWCPPLRRVMAEAGWRAAVATWPSGTWPVAVPFLHIPIDHLLLDGAWAAVRVRTGPDIGSDHFPVLVDVARMDNAD